MIIVGKLQLFFANRAQMTSLSPRTSDSERPKVCQQCQVGKVAAKLNVLLNGEPRMMWICKACAVDSVTRRDTSDGRMCERCCRAPSVARVAQPDGRRILMCKDCAVAEPPTKKGLNQVVGFCVCRIYFILFCAASLFIYLYFVVVFRKKLILITFLILFVLLV